MEDGQKWEAVGIDGNEQVGLYILVNNSCTLLKST